MRFSFTLLFCLLLNCVSLTSHSQQAAAVDSMKQAIAESKTIQEKARWIGSLSHTLMNVNLKEADDYGNQYIALAEETRDRQLMFDAYLSNGTRCSYYSGRQDYALRAIEYFKKALNIARENKMESAKGAALLKLSHIYLNIPDNDKSLNYANQAASVISSLKDDSLRAESSNTFGNVYLARNDKILALSHYLNALRIAEDIKEPANPALLRACYQYLSNFYSGIEDYDRAIDYAMDALHKLDDIHEKFVPYQRAIDMNNIGKLYAAKKNDDIAISYFKRSLLIADSMKFSTLKIPAYISILDQYLRVDQPQKALDYLNSAEGASLRKFMTDFGFTGNIDMTYGSIYSKLGKYDSARYFFTNAAVFYDKSPNPVGKMYFYMQRAAFYKRVGENANAITGYLTVKELAEKLGELEVVEKVAKQLDTLYQREGNYQQANFYNSVYYQYKDSIQVLNKEKELAQLEAADEQQRQARLELAKEEKKRRKNNIQYMAITIGIVGLFLALVVLGMFKVSATTIKMIGFFAFLMFFEFVFLIFKKNIYSITHGEPWKDLLFMIGLAAILLPLHHWLEEKVIHYLTSHNRLTAAGNHLRMKFFRRNKPGAV